MFEWKVESCYISRVDGIRLLERDPQFAGHGCVWLATGFAY